LNAVAASTSHAELAAKLPERRWASGPFFRSAMTCSTMASVGLGGEHRQRRVGEDRMVAPDRRIGVDASSIKVPLATDGRSARPRSLRMGNRGTNAGRGKCGGPRLSEDLEGASVVDLPAHNRISWLFERSPDELSVM
jgi:hypothetical protein